jgi:methionine-rich copper-binding protein CopC
MMLRNLSVDHCVDSATVHDAPAKIDPQISDRLSGGFATVALSQ